MFSLPRHTSPNVRFAKIARRSGHTGDYKTFPLLQTQMAGSYYASFIKLR